MKTLYEAIQNKEQVREHLVQLKQRLKDPREKTTFEKLCQGKYDFLMRLLIDEDPKVRKHVAAVLGTLRCQEALDVLWDAYDAEETRYVRADYVRAMAALDCREYLPEIRAKLEELTEYQPLEEERKHVQEEWKELQELLLAQDQAVKHEFTGWHVPNEVILVTLPAFRNITANQIQNVPTTIMGMGVKVKTADLESILKIRSFKEVLFVLHGVKLLEGTPEALAEGLLGSDLLEIVAKNHQQSGPYCFRLTVGGTMPADKKSLLIKKTAQLIEERSKRDLINSASHYEMEIRLLPNKEGLYYPCLKLYTLKDQRFAYRRQVLDTGMQPYVAAGLLQLAAPYMKEHAQVLDPVCGAGTLLIERNYLLPTRSAYGIDTYGEAIEKARANTKVARMTINYIQRNFKDFSHEYLFDEIYADMPQKGSLSYDDLSVLYQKLFDRAEEWLNPSGILVLYSSEVGFVKKQIRIHNGMRLLKEICISEKQKQYLYIIQYR